MYTNKLLGYIVPECSGARSEFVLSVGEYGRLNIWWGLIRIGLSADLDHLSFIKDIFPEEFTIPGNHPPAVPVTIFILPLTSPGPGELIPAGLNPFSVPGHLFLPIHIPLTPLKPFPIILPERPNQFPLTLMGNNTKRPNRFSRPDVKSHKYNPDSQRDKHGQEFYLSLLRHL